MSDQIRILVIEDSPADAELEERELRRSGLEFSARRVDALPALSAALADFRPDLIIADFTLPGFTAMDVLALVYELSPETPVIVVTGSVNEETAADCIKAGAADYVLKGHLARLAPAARAALDHRRALEERAKAEEALRASEERYRALFTESRDGFFIADAASQQLLDANPAMFAMSGFRPETALGEPLLRLVAPEMAAAAQAAWETTARGGTLGPIELEMVRSDGSRLPVEARAASYRDAGGGVRLLGVVRDISERRAREAEMRASEARHRTLFEEASDAVFIADPATGLIMDANRAARRMTGRSLAELCAMHQTDLHPPEEQAAARTAFRRGRERPSHVPQHFHVRHRDGRSIPVEITASLISDADGRPLLVGFFRDLSERLEADRAIRESTNRFQLAIQAASEGILIHADGAIRSANPAAARLFGATGPDDLVGRWMLDLVHPEWRERVRQRIAAVTERGEAAPALEEVLLRVDGSPFHAEASAVPIDQDGRPGVLVFYRDISERVAADAAVAESEKRFRSVVEGAPEAILIHVDGIITYVNRAAVELFGASDADDLVGRPVIERVHPDYRDAVRRRVSEVTDAGGIASAMDEILTRLDGGPLVAEVSAVRLAQEGRAAVLVFARDVTDQRRMSAERARLSAALEQAAEIVLITDPRGTIQYVNPAFERVTGYPRAEAVGQNPRLLKSGVQGPEEYRRLWATLTAGETFNGTFVNRKKNGDHYVAEVVISPIRDASGAVVAYVGLQRDVTHEHDLENQLRQSQKMEALGQLTGGIAHDFNNLLNVILTNLALARDELTGESAGVRAYLRDAEQAALHGSAMVRKLLAFGRREQLRLGPLDLSRTVIDLERTFRRLLPESIHVRLQPAPEALPVAADEGAIEQMVLNLVTNARDAMVHGGQLTLGLSEVHFREDDDPMVFGYEAPGHYACLSVTDSGAGMDEPTLARAFEPFFTTKPAGAGTGLGLPMVFGLMKQHGGFLRIYSEPGLGTSVRLYFPLLATPLVAPHEERQAGPVQVGNETILLVEDQEMLRRAAARALTKLGYDVLVAADGLEGAQVLREHGDRISLVLSDLVMPRLGGVELYQRVRAEGRNVRFVLMSGYATSPSGTPPPPEVRIIEKPWTIDALARALREVLAAPPPD